MRVWYRQSDIANLPLLTSATWYAPSSRHGLGFLDTNELQHEQYRNLQRPKQIKEVS